MDAARRAMCTDDLLNPLTSTFIQSCAMLLFSHIFHVVLKPLGQPGPIAQILAGFTLGPSILSRIKQVGDLFNQPDLNDYILLVSFIFRIAIMFLIGLETDVPYMRRNLRRASIIAMGGVAAGVIFGAAITVFVMRMLTISDSQLTFANLIIIILTSSASPVVIRFVTELKFETAEIGRLAISTTLVNEMSCLIWYDIAMAFSSGKLFGDGILCLMFTGLVTGVNKFLALWYNRRRQNERYLRSTDVLIILSLVIWFSFLIEEFGYNSTVFCFIMGLMYPREGKTTRTLLNKLTYAANNFILPIHFGFIGFRLDVRHLYSLRNAIVVMLVVLISIGAKIIGTLAACHYLKTPLNQGVILAFILNFKGHSELLLVDTLSKPTYDWWDENFHHLVVIVIVLNTVISGSVVSCTLRRDENYFLARHSILEFDDPENELRMMFCVYSSRQISAKFGLILALRGSARAPIKPYLMHLVELPKKRSTTKLMYHELEDRDNFSDEEEYGGNDVTNICEAVDAFSTDNKVPISQKKIVSSFATMYEDICSSAEDSRVSIIILTFHKHQRLDGKMENSSEADRLNNQKILRHASCTVGIYVDRGQTGFQLPTSGHEQHVVAIFFGGPDDREALAWSKRIASHPNINLTVIRFLLATSHDLRRPSTKSTEEILLTMSDYHETENERDNASMEDFYNRYVIPGKAGYVEKFVNNGKETAEVLAEIRQMYALIIVGKGDQGFSPLTTGLSDWEEFPELGNVGDLLASSEFKANGSILVIQQYRLSRNHYHLLHG
ncbi:cation/H(+) antiporter 1-like [Euphorbia lathyris]|uniref:cation/H(+) antiporter 1-like n=1 Tax=Euphorbia lathyris TaxID=212925 RepID=UPI003313E3E4